MKHVYIVSQDSRTFPCKSHNDTQKHVLGVHSNKASAFVHANSCVASRIERGMVEIRRNYYKHPRGPREFHESIEFGVYLSTPDRSETCEFTIHRHTVKR